MQDEGVTPVVGTVMILGITILGIGAIMLWGAPTLQAIQDRNSVIAMQGEFIEVRTGTLDLMIDKSSRVPEIVVDSGVLSLDEGTRFLITSDQFQAKAIDYADCTFIVEDWTNDAGTFTVDLSACSALSVPPTANCETAVLGELCIVLSAVTGSNENDAVLALTGGAAGVWSFSSGEDLSTGDWVFRLYEDNGEVAGQSWLLGTDRLHWTLSTISGNYGVSLEGGAVFEQNGIRTYLVKSPALQEDASGTGDMFFRVPTYTAERGGVSAPITASVFIGQVGNNHVRIQSDETEHIRFAFDGELGEAWCRSLLARNNQLSTATYAEPTTNSCDDAPAVVTFEHDDGLPFPFELSHARITTRIQV